MTEHNAQTETATFAAGCFWGVEEAFRKVPGVLDTKVGYTGGEVPDPTYEHVCAGDTGHAEAVQIRYDPKQVSYDELLDVFWSEHDPTQVGGQGLDVGDQYRSVVFYHTDEQKKAAETSLDHLQKQRYGGKKITTGIVPTREFYPAEEYHQRYIQKRRSGQ